MPAKDVKEATIELTDSYGDTFATVETETEAKVEESKKEVELDTYDIESMTEAVRIPAKTGNIVMVNLGWKGKYYSIKMFFPQVSKPSRKDVQDQIEKIYPGGKLYTFVVSNYEPGEPMLHAEEQHGQRKKERTNLEDSTKKDESLTKEKIQDLTSRHQAKRLETPVGHRFVLE